MTIEQFKALPDQEQFFLLTKHWDNLDGLISDLQSVDLSEAYAPGDDYPLVKEWKAAQDRIAELEAENARLNRMRILVHEYLYYTKEDEIHLPEVFILLGYQANGLTP